MSLSKQNFIKKKLKDKNIKKLYTGNNNEKYKIEATWNSMVYTNKSKVDQLLSFYYSVG